YPYSLLHPALSTSDPYTLSLHDALPISSRSKYGCVSPVFPRIAEGERHRPPILQRRSGMAPGAPRSSSQNRVDCERKRIRADPRSEEHTSELQSLAYLVCRLLLEKKKTN